MPRRGAARGLDEWEQQTLGGHMDDYFGGKEDHAAEDAYEHAWIDSGVFQKERIQQLEQEIDRLRSDLTGLLNEQTDAYYD